MSTNVEVIERLYEAWNRGDLDGLFDVCDPEVEVRPAFGAMLSSTVYSGHEGVRMWHADTYEPWAELRAEPQRFIEDGERTIVVLALHARVAGGQVELAGAIAHVVTVHDGRIVRVDGYEDPEAALATLGNPGS
jgi:ketosteroid isomerase-like protein